MAICFGPRNRIQFRFHVSYQADTHFSGRVLPRIFVPIGPNPSPVVWHFRTMPSIQLHTIIGLHVCVCVSFIPPMIRLGVLVNIPDLLSKAFIQLCRQSRCSTLLITFSFDFRCGILLLPGHITNHIFEILRVCVSVRKGAYNVPKTWHPMHHVLRIIFTAVRSIGLLNAFMAQLEVESLEWKVIHTNNVFRRPLEIQVFM